MLIMKLFLLGLFIGQVLCHAETPTFHFEDKITWKQVFDSGFRPKHLEGLENHKCVCKNQDFQLQFKDRELKFRLDKGSIDFDFLHNDFLRMIWHQGGEAITLEEGRRRADEFKKVFDGYI